MMFKLKNEKGERWHQNYTLVIKREYYKGYKNNKLNFNQERNHNSKVHINRQKQQKWKKKLWQENDNVRKKKHSVLIKMETYTFYIQAKMTNK